MTDETKTPRHCIKCGNSDIYVRWHESSNDCAFDYRQRHGYFGSKKLFQHLHMTCRVCGFEWEEPCRDAAKRGD